MSFFIVDVESDGPAPGLFSMVSFAAVKVCDINKSFMVKVAPITSNYDPKALGISGISRQVHETYDNPHRAMTAFARWLDHNNEKGRPVFLSDNNGFDWQFINYYFWKYLNFNPFGFSSRRIGDIFSGAVKNLRASNDWKRFRITKHTHDPRDDARGNMEAFKHFTNAMGIK